MYGDDDDRLWPQGSALSQWFSRSPDDIEEERGYENAVKRYNGYHNGHAARRPSSGDFRLNGDKPPMKITLDGEEAGFGK